LLATILVMTENRETDRITSSDVLQTKLAEHRAAQESAEHHERISWLARNIMWFASTTLLGSSAVSSIRPAVLAIMAGCGIALVVFPMLWNAELGKIKNARMQRCKEIELALGMRVHLGTPVTNRLTLAWLLVVFLVAAWTARITLAFCAT
jgi:hypothetical protein